MPLSTTHESHKNSYNCILFLPISSTLVQKYELLISNPVYELIVTTYR